jgi:hypothetical protein
MAGNVWRITYHDTHFDRLIVRYAPVMKDIKHPNSLKSALQAVIIHQRNHNDVWLAAQQRMMCMDHCQ